MRAVCGRLRAVIYGISTVITCAIWEGRAAATVVERVVAVIGERAVFLSDLRLRAQPNLIQVHQSVPAGAQRAAAISQVYKLVLEKMVDEELEDRAAAQAKISVTPSEIDDAITRLSAQNKLTRKQLLEEARRNGLGEREYKEELRHQLLQAKLINLRLQGRIRVTDEDVRSAYQRLEAEERQRLLVRAAWIVISGSGDNLRVQAEQVALAARREDFAKLAQIHSSDVKTRETGGELGRVRPNQLAPTLARALAGLEVGEVSPALREGDQYVVFKVLEREASTLPALEEARHELLERVYVEKMNRARRNWLDGMRRQSHVEIRL